MSAKLTKFTNDISSTSVNRSRASPLIRMLRSHLGEDL